MYGKLFASLYQGTLRGKAHEILVFTNLIAHCDKEGFVDKHFRAIAEETGLTADEVKSAIEELEKPDDESRSPELGGRRIIRIDDHRAWGWRVVNFLKYRSIRDEETRRETWRKSQEKARLAKKGQPTSTPVNTCQHLSTHTDTEADTKKKKEDRKAFQKPTIQEIQEFGMTLTPPFTKAETFFNWYEANGWKTGKNPIKDWKACVRTWHIKDKENLPEQPKPKTFID